jgi:prepilin-type N-terminal cleavage/methylation domain-containing protein
MRSKSQTGVTLIELMIAVALLAVLAVAAIPSFVAFRERAVTRGAADELVSAMAEARFEAIRSDRRVSVSVRSGDTEDVWCIGWRVIAPAAPATECDCFETLPANANFCGAGRLPAFQDEATGGPVGDQARAMLRGARLVGGADFDDGDTGFTFESKGGLALKLTTGEPLLPPATGVAEIRSPSPAHDYRLRVEVTTLGRASVCAVEVVGKSKIPGVPVCA